jgi:hypothetical protein
MPYIAMRRNNFWTRCFVAMLPLFLALAFRTPAAAQIASTTSPATANPVFSPNGGTYTSQQNVTITAATSGAVIYYTTNGSAPTTASAQYSGAISVSGTETIKAMAVAKSHANSAVVSQSYIITPPAVTPQITPAAGTYLATQTIKIASATPGAVIYYTTNGSTPTSSSSLYTGPLTVATSQTVIAIAIALGYSQSASASASYNITPPAATPAFTIAQGTYTATQVVGITDATPGSVIYYSTNKTAPTTSSPKYTAPIALPSTQTIAAVAIAPGYSLSSSASATYTITPPAAAPAFTVAAGTYISAQTVGIADATPGAIIYYTTNGSAPTTSSLQYTGPLTIASTETVTAIAIAAGYSQSGTVSATYTITPPAAAPTLTPAAGTYLSTQTVRIADITPGASIYYTTNGAPPTSSSTPYTGPITVPTSETVNAVAIAAGYSLSAAAAATYTIAPPAATPGFTVATGTYTSAQIVSITDTTPGAVIYYTTDGSIPTSASMLYMGPITVRSTQTINAVALAQGFSQSAVATATYTMTMPAATPVFSPGAGSYASAQSVSITDSTPAATIYYTTNGSTPATSSAVYVAPIAVTSNETIRAIALAPGYTGSAVATAAFILGGGPAIVMPAPLPTAYVGAAYSASIEASGNGASYLWTINGATVPANGSPVALADGITVSNTGNYLLAIGGKPNTAGTLTASVSVTNEFTGEQAQPVTLTIPVSSPARLSLPAPNPGSLVPGVQHTNYTGFVEVTGGVPPYNWTVTGLPGTMTTPGSAPILSIAGNGTAGDSGDGSAAVQAQINDSGGIAVDLFGNVYFAEPASNRVRMIAPSGVISTVAGTGLSGYNGDNIPAASAELSVPVGVAVDLAGDLLIADAGNARIRMISVATGQISTVAGTGVAGYGGDGLASTNAKLNDPTGVAVDSAGNLYIADSGNARVREANAATGVIATIAGTGTTGYNGDGGLAIQAQLRNPYGITLDRQGNVYVADLTGLPGVSTTSGRIREVNSVTGIITTVGGNGSPGYNGDSIPAITANLSNPVSIAIDNSGNIYIADAGNDRIRVVSALTGVIATAVGTGAPGYNGDNIAALDANIDNPLGVALDASGNIYIADGNSRIRMVQAPSANSVLAIRGNPPAAGTVTFQASVTDATGTTAGPVKYSFNVAAPAVLTLPVPNPSSLAAGIVNQPYTGTILASGGVPNYTWTVNGAKVPAGGVPMGLGSGWSVSATGSTLTINGLPTSVGSGGIEVAVTDGMGRATGTIVYTIFVMAAAGYQVSGQINSVNCNAPAAGITVTINTTPAQVASTDSNGRFSFSNIPSGNFTITPSVNAPSSIFYPSSAAIGVNGSPIAGVNFQSELGYQVSGGVGAVTNVSGWTHLSLTSSGCPGLTFGTVIPSAEAFAIRGVPPGNYTMQVWVDQQGTGVQNASDATGVLSNLTVANSNLGSLLITPVAVPAITLNSPPSIISGSGVPAGVFLTYAPIMGANGLELATSYTVEWSTSSSFASIAGTHNFKATGNGANVWIFGITSGTSYYFRAQGMAGNSITPWSASYGPVTPGAPTSGNTVTGTITFTATSGIPIGPLYVGFRDQNSGTAYVTGIAHPFSPQTYTVKVPTGSNYTMFALVDENQDGMADLGDLTSMSGNPVVAITGNTTENLKILTVDPVTLTTQHYRQSSQSGVSDSYGLSFNMATQNLPPLVVSLISGPNLISPMDIGPCNNCGTEPFSFSVDIGTAVPDVGDSYTLEFMDDGRSGYYVETSSVAVTGVVEDFATNLSVATANGSTTTPVFTWSDPADGSQYTYQFTLVDAKGNLVWQVPAEGAQSSGFSNSITSITWGTDPTGAANPPSVPSLTAGEIYLWTIAVQDANGNTAVTPMTYQP